MTRHLFWAAVAAAILAGLWAYATDPRHLIHLDIDQEDA